jgi:hypothetical protein
MKKNRVRVFLDISSSKLQKLSCKERERERVRERERKSVSVCVCERESGGVGGRVTFFKQKSSICFFESLPFENVSK